MSETEFWVGRIRKVQLNEGESLEERLIALYKEYSIFPAEWDGDMFDLYDLIWDSDDLCDKYIILNNELYERQTQQWEPDSIECILKPTEDGWLEFMTSFYNGGGSLGEVLEDALDDLYGRESNGD